MAAAVRAGLRLALRRCSRLAGAAGAQRPVGERPRGDGLVPARTSAGSRSASARRRCRSAAPSRRSCSRSSAAPRAGFLFLAGLVLAGALAAALVLRDGPQRAISSAARVASTLRDRRLWHRVLRRSGLYLVAQLGAHGLRRPLPARRAWAGDGAAAAVLAASQVGSAARSGSPSAAGRTSLRLRVRPLRASGSRPSRPLGAHARPSRRAAARLLVPALVVAAASRWAGTGSRSRSRPSSAGPRSGAAIGLQQTVLSVTGIVVRRRVRRGVSATSWRAAFALARALPARWLVGAASARRALAPAEKPCTCMSSLERLDALYAIGGGPGRQPDRLLRRRRTRRTQLAAGWMDEAGLEVEVDAHGNLSAVCAGDEPDLPEVWSGSHLDSVPHGGRFDGALGVVAGDRGARAARPAAADARGRCVPRGGARVCRQPRRCVARGDAPGCVSRAPPRAGPAARARRGAARRRHRDRRLQARPKAFEGRAGHAGTTPMEGRDDALVAAAAEILRIRDVALGDRGRRGDGRPARGRAGRHQRDPGRVASRSTRGRPIRQRLDRLLAEVGHIPVTSRLRRPRSAARRRALRAGDRARGLPVVELFSGAGHDAG